MVLASTVDRLGPRLDLTAHNLQTGLRGEEEHGKEFSASNTWNMIRTRHIKDMLSTGTRMKVWGVMQGCPFSPSPDWAEILARILGATRDRLASILLRFALHVTVYYFALGIILSLLPTKLAVSTSVLSKRWMNLLPLVDSSLDFDDPIFLYPDHRDAAATARSSSGFSDFVDKTVALLSTCPIKTLSVNGHCYENSRVDDWIRVSLQRSLSELHLRCPHRIDKDRVELLFRSKTLVKLTLSDGCLYLGDIVIDDSYYFKVILICPVLEELFIRNDGVSHPPSWIGLVPSYPLKRLVIYYLVLLPEYKDVYSDIEVRIGGPQNLVFFEFSSYVHVYYDSFGDMESLVEARLNLRLLESPVVNL
uniref:FBD domain-containing protein n=1 Tax=Brassica oleracea TaxID=3712 RepID=A0A3P6GA57_BRAOL|nr:unnamed protein product [Brassica oleracea]